jgi:hypothetical protein
MRIYRKDANRTANAIAEVIKKSELWGTSERISKEAYDWLYMNANSLAQLVEELLNDDYTVWIEREKEYGEYGMHIEWRRHIKHSNQTLEDFSGYGDEWDGVE